ncbi:antitoxin [Amycolatopsis sp. PS_44_ISF1]|uniref:antitoxin n=1 Tax=Amycolatopsis sp. PS_44_ISF1 TaxID=2974917 RepID=UPI0028E0710E|nr:antitoxin [Amycolatopsis sp. PS_44_ISF1]MDT8914906.1 antitoxin [Amycolatopsis sp. PS_44_ISF1]
MALMKRLAVLATAAGAVQSYARKNPEKVNQFVGRAATFVDSKTKGKYHNQLSGAVRKVSDATRPRPGH